MANEKEMNPMSGDQVETDGIYRDPYGHEIKLLAGEDFPMDPQLGKVEYEMIAFDFEDGRTTDEDAAHQANVPLSAVQEESEEAKQSRQLKHRLHGGNR